MSDKIKIRCPVKSCEKCEMCRPHSIIFITQKFFEENREEKKGFKCGRYGHCATSKKELHKGGYIDDFIYMD